MCTLYTSVYDIPLYYISFKKNPKVEQHYKNYGFKDVNHFEAVNGKKLDIDSMLKDNLITIRSYDDVKSDRSEHSGMPSAGALGCSLSHYSLWKMCVDNNWEAVIIAEEDNRMTDPLPEQKIKTVLAQPDSVFISVKIKKEDHRKHFFGTHFYILNQSACKKLLSRFFPIDVQVDWYLANLATVGEINLVGEPVSEQTTPMGASSIQRICVKCILPKNPWFYATIILLFLMVCYGVYRYRKKFVACEKSCASLGE